jgi:hypothetical protein
VRKSVILIDINENRTGTPLALIKKMTERYQNRMASHNNNPRFGLHYFPDTYHYRDTDLNLWLPKIHALGASWLTLIAPINRAIPEEFITGLVREGIQPVIHFKLPLDNSFRVESLSILLETYAKWGVKHVVLFDRPNQRSNWPMSYWTRDNLVERFLDIYIPGISLVNQLGLTPIFPPLEPGGDYWDTSFLRASLRGLVRRGHGELANILVLSAYAWTGNLSLNWGAGGPERWPGSRPYRSFHDVEDQRGYRIFEWYIAEAQAITGKPPRVIVLAGGSLPQDLIDPRTALPATDAHAQRNLTLIRLLDSPIDDMEAIPPEVLTCNFWLLSCGEDSQYLSEAWFKPNGQALPIVNILRNWNAKRNSNQGSGMVGSRKIIEDGNSSQIEHYLLIPSYEWGIADWHLEAIRPYVKKHRPTVGFSLREAAKAKKVTVIGDSKSYPDNFVDSLITAGCSVELIEGDGTTIATKLAAL